MILSFKAVQFFKSIPFRDLSLLANYFSRLEDYNRFSRTLSRFLSRHRWASDLGLAPRNPSWVGRNVTAALTVLGLVIALTVTDTLRAQIYAILTEATTGGLSQLIGALVIYLGLMPVTSRAGSSYSRRIARSHIAAFEESV